MQVKRYFIQLAYKGTNYFGWQIQPNAITVQENIMQAIAQINRNKPVKVTGCGRTDTGVHASKYFAHVDMMLPMELEKFTFKLNCMLPADIVIQKISEVPNDLHSRFSATSRTYHYHIHQFKDPFLNETSWQLLAPLDVALMNEGGKFLLTQTNFKSFSKTPSNGSNYTCELTEAVWTEKDGRLQFTISANRFLRNMVRAIVGTLVKLGSGKISLDTFKEIVQNQDRRLAGKSAPACGLFLTDIIYPDLPLELHEGEGI
jgi:tRNA pseudouridine38-40 synthase